MIRFFVFILGCLFLFSACKTEPKTADGAQKEMETKRPAKISARNLIGFKDQKAVTANGTVIDIPGLTDEKQSTYFLVRHAEKKSDGPDPDLTQAGMARAAKLAALLNDLKIDQVMSTDYKRTQATVAPLAKAKNLAVQSYDPVSQKDLFTDLSVFNKQNVVVAGHSNTIPQLANTLIGKNVFTDYAEDDYSQLVIISLSQPGMATYEQFEF